MDQAKCIDETVERLARDAELDARRTHFRPRIARGRMDAAAAGGLAADGFQVTILSSSSKGEALTTGLKRIAS